YLLADCLIRLAPLKAEDALAENKMREKLTAASGLLENYVASHPKAADAPEALLKLGLCLKRLGASLADANERNQLLNKSREFFEKLNKDYGTSLAAPHARLEAAKIKALLGDRGGAMNDLRQFASADDKNPVAAIALLHLATLHREQNEFPQAGQVLADARTKHEAALRADPARADWADLLKYHHGVALLEAKKPAEGQKLLEEVSTSAKGKPVGAEAALRSLQAGVELAKQEREAAEQKLNQGNLKDPERQAAEQKREKARQQLFQVLERTWRHYDEARQKLPEAEVVARLLYDSAWAYRPLAEREIQDTWKRLREDAAKKQLETVTKKLPKDAPLPTLLPPEVPRSQVPVEDYEHRQFECYKRLIHDYPDLSLALEARFEYAELLAERGDHAAAIPLLREALDKEPTDRAPAPEFLEKVRLRLGASLLATKDAPGALKQFEMVAGNTKSPWRGPAQYRAAECLLSTGKLAEAAAQLKPFQDKGEWQNIPGISDRALVRLGQCQLALKQWELARQAFEQFTQRYGQSPQLAEARYGWGIALQQLNQYDPAVAQFEQVPRLTGGLVAAQAQLQVGLCRMAQKKYAEATGALLLVPYGYDAPELGFTAMLEAARALEMQNDAPGALRLLTRLEQTAPPGSDWVKSAAERKKGLAK
ncbi:MAG: tetratricopeptide repeat protein, partial [Gemmataceae bacterium]